MSTTVITLTEGDDALLRDLARQTGRPADELVHEALGLLRDKVTDRQQSLLERLRRAQGMWKDRDDLPSLDELRGEWERRLDDLGIDAG